VQAARGRRAWTAETVELGHERGHRARIVEVDHGRARRAGRDRDVGVGPALEPRPDDVDVGCGVLDAVLGQRPLVAWPAQQNRPAARGERLRGLNRAHVAIRSASPALR
jgi:hypothetical protein